MAGLIQHGQGRLIRRTFLDAAILQVRALRHLRPARNDRLAGAALAGNGGGGAQDKGHDGLGRGVAQGILGPGQMAAGYVAGFMGDDANHLICVVRGGQQAGIDKYLLPAGDKGVEGGVIYQVYAHRRRLQACDGKEWCAEEANGTLDLRIADKTE